MPKKMKHNNEALCLSVILVENATYFSSSEWVAVNGLRYFEESVLQSCKVA